MEPDREGTTEWRTVDPRVRWLWLLSGLLGAAILGLGAFIADEAWLSKKEWWPFRPGLAGGAAAGLLGLRALVRPWLRFRTFRYAAGERDLTLRDGILWRTVTSVPRSRVQHVEVNCGPLERYLGLATLEVFTAGKGEADLEIGGLPSRTAEDLRASLLEIEGEDV